jgi:serine/threonine-protein kinase
MISASPVRIGEVLAGKYRVERLLGSGGMGVVVAAIHVDLGQRVALKFLLPDALANAEASHRFLREARAAVRIESEHVARVLDVGRLENGAPYMVMEYLDGIDLSAHTTGARLPLEDAVDFVLQACEAMAVAHACGIVHRDLKPANLFVTKRPDGSPLVKVLDFGISKISILDAPAALTNTGAMMGSPLYMSPEQVQSARRVDARTDIWSLGVILFELLTGTTPFEGESLGEVLTAVITTAPKSLRALRPDLPSGLELAVMRALEKPPERRYANVGEFAAALIEFAPARSRVLLDRVSGVMNRAGFSSAPPPPPPGEKTIANPPSAVPPPAAEARAGTAGTNASWVGGSMPPKRAGKTPLALAAAGLLVAGIAVMLLARRGPSASEQPVPSSALVAPRPSPAAAQPPLAPTTAPAVSVAPLVASAADAGASSESPSKSAGAQRAPSKLGGAARTQRASAAATPSVQSPYKKNPLNIQFK